MKRIVLSLLIMFTTRTLFTDKCFHTDPKSKAKNKVKPGSIIYSVLMANSQIKWPLTQNVAPFESAKYVVLNDEEFADDVVIIKKIPIGVITGELANTRMKLDDLVQEDQFIDCQIDATHVYILKTVMLWSDICEVLDNSPTIFADLQQNRIKKAKEAREAETLNWPDVLNKISTSSSVANGSFGKLYIMDLGGKSVAVKSAALSRNRIEEVKIFQEMSDQKITPDFFGCASDGTTLYLVQEKMFDTLSGFNFLKKFRNEKKDIKSRLAFYRDVVGSVLGFLNKGYVHFDIKPENLMVNPAMEPRVIDLGFAVKVGTLDHGLATKKYKSPDRGENKVVNPNADTFALILSLISLEAKFANREAFTNNIFFDADKKVKADWAKMSEFTEAERQIVFNHFAELVKTSWGQYQGTSTDFGSLNLTSLAKRIFVDLNQNATTKALYDALVRLSARRIV